MTVAEFFGMSSKFAECTLGQKYRIIKPDGTVGGGLMYYLSRGLSSIGMNKICKGLGVLYAISCAIATMGAGNMFQANQAYVAVSNVLPFFDNLDWLFGIILVAIASLVATPLGVVLLDRIPEATALTGLGILIVSYVLYDWFNLSLPKLQSSFWAYLFGGVSGILNGAYTVNRPPLIIYGNCRRWTPQEFKGNLGALFFFSSVLAAIAHGF